MHILVCGTSVHRLNEINIHQGYIDVALEGLLLLIQEKRNIIGNSPLNALDETLIRISNLIVLNRPALLGLL